MSLADLFMQLKIQAERTGTDRRLDLKGGARLADGAAALGSAGVSVAKSALTIAVRIPRADRAARHGGIHRTDARAAASLASDEQRDDRHRADVRGHLEPDRLGRLRDDG